MTSPLDMLAVADRLFEYHAPDEDQIAAIQAVRKAAKTLCVTMLQHCPNDAPELKTALGRLSEAVMHANASIVRPPVPSPTLQAPTGGALDF